MKISREGIPTILIVNVILAISVVGMVLTDSIWVTSLTILLTGVDLLILYFFRDPDRTVPDGKNLVVSPGDGTVVLIDRVHEGDFFQEEVTQVSIFLSVFNVHVNRIPISGSVKYCRHVTGKFLAAFKKEASLENEQSHIGIVNPECKLLFKQIAGLLARRIVFNVAEGDDVIQGNRFGIIKFGSRIDIFLPLKVKLHVKIGDKVRGGESIVGTIPSSSIDEREDELQFESFTENTDSEVASPVLETTVV